MFNGIRHINFPLNYEAILARIDAIDPKHYAKSRNYIDGGVSFLSPYISRGVISTKVVYQRLKDKGISLFHMEKFVQELAWRDFWQRQWQHHGAAINQDLKRAQEEVQQYGIPEAVIQAKTGIQAIDQAIKDLYSSGYMHNHLRMYVASLVCNVAKCHWYQPAQWMFNHLLDGDWASNALSWQWVAGSNSNKKYWANQENINHFCRTSQNGSYLDKTYDALPAQESPSELTHVTNLTQILADTPESKTKYSSFKLSADKNQGAPPALCVYTPYNLDPNWRTELDAKRILLLDEAYLQTYPISPKVLDFIIELGQANIPELAVYFSSFDTLKTAFPNSAIYIKEHPAFSYNADVVDSRDWLAQEAPYKGSFFSYWKGCRKILVKPS